MINVTDMTLTYSSGKGVFDLDFIIREGETVGYLGPNGSGKTTTVRALLGFMQPDRGACTISGLDCFAKASHIQKRLGYIPGEISFFDNMDGNDFLAFMHAMRKTCSTDRQNQLLEQFDLDPRGKIRRFSKGMKQKLGIVTAFMHDPEILILDEPTSGLDPLMQGRFIKLIQQEKARGKTILMSSHSFPEVERTCDNALIIKEGRIVSFSDVLSLKNSQRRCYLIRSDNQEKTAELLKRAAFTVSKTNQDMIEVYVTGENIDRLIKTLAQIKIDDINVKNQTLEDIFMQYYG